MTRQPFLKLYYELRIDGKMVGRKRLSRSFVVGMARLLLVNIQNASAGSQNDTGGVSRTPVTNANNLLCTAAIDTSANGIVVGTGTTAVAVADTKLATQIATGNSSGQLRYMIQQFGSLTATSTTNDFQLIRSFQNNSGGSITVNEMGIYAEATTTPSFFCIVRDVIGGGVAVANAKVLTVTYTFSFAI